MPETELVMEYFVIKLNRYFNVHDLGTLIAEKIIENRTTISGEDLAKIIVQCKAD